MNAFLQATAIAAVSVAGALATWRIVGPPDRGLAPVPCTPATVPAGEVCLATVTGEWAGKVLWADARPRAEWQRNGLTGSLLLTPDAAENFDSLVADALPKLAEAKRVVIYCADTGCGTSHEVAKRLKAYGIGPEYHVLHGGWRALTTAGLVNDPK